MVGGAPALVHLTLPDVRRGEAILGSHYGQRGTHQPTRRIGMVPAQKTAPNAGSGSRPHLAGRTMPITLLRHSKPKRKRYDAPKAGSLEEGLGVARRDRTFTASAFNDDGKAIPRHAQSATSSSPTNTLSCAITGSINPAAINRFAPCRPVQRWSGRGC